MRFGLFLFFLSFFATVEAFPKDKTVDGSNSEVDQYPITEPKREKRFTKDNLLGLIGNLDDGLTNLKGKLGHGRKLIPGLEALKGLLGDYMDKLNIKKSASLHK